MEIVAARPAAAVSEAPSANNNSQNRDLARAVTTLNEVGVAGPDRQFSFSIDPKTKLAVIRITDSVTGDVIDQVPLESVLQVAQQVQELRSRNGEPAR